MEEDIRRRISREPRYGVVLYRILGDCLKPIAFSALESRICAYPEMRVQLYEPATLVSWLMDAEALESLSEGCREPDPRQIALFEIANADTGIAWESGAGDRNGGDVVLVATEGGKRVWIEHEKADEITHLFETAGALGKTYRRVLELCRTPQSKKALEQTLMAEGLLDLRQRQVSCFLDKLEKAGVLVWDKGWVTTQRGLAEIA